jgi:hypothetical protein
MEDLTLVLGPVTTTEASSNDQILWMALGGVT